MQDTPSGNGTFPEASGAVATPSAISAPVPLSDRTLSTLRQRFGAEADAKIADAGALIDQAAERWPDVRRFIDCAGLADSPHLIALLAARVEYRRTDAARIAEQNRARMRRLYEKRRRART